MSENNSSGIIGGFLVGALVGAGLALMLAPASGEETRRLLADKAKSLRTTALDALDGVQQTVKDKTSGVTAAFQEGRAAYRQSVQDSAAHTQNG